MTAQIIPFPSRTVDAKRLASVGQHLQSAIPMPASADMELSMLLQIGAKLLDNLNSYERPDCSGLMEAWLDRLHAWEGEIGP